MSSHLQPLAATQTLATHARLAVLAAIVIAVGNDGQFARFAALLGHAEWAQDPAFATNAARIAARDRLVPAAALSQLLYVDSRS